MKEYNEEELEMDLSWLNEFGIDTKDATEFIFSLLNKKATIKLQIIQNLK